MTESVEQQVRELFDPVLSVFGGEDGGVAFGKLRHQFATALLSKPNRTPVEESVIVMMTQYARLCKLALDGKL